MNSRAYWLSCCVSVMVLIYALCTETWELLPIACGGLGIPLSRGTKPVGRRSRPDGMEGIGLMVVDPYYTEHVGLLGEDVATELFRLRRAYLAGDTDTIDYLLAVDAVELDPAKRVKTEPRVSQPNPFIPHYAPPPKPPDAARSAMPSYVVPGSSDHGLAQHRRTPAMDVSSGWRDPNHMMHMIQVGAVSLSEVRSKALMDVSRIEDRVSTERYWYRTEKQR